MGFRFRKSIRIMPGVRINLSRSGVSTSIGGRGATLNLGGKGARATVDLPGTGLSYSTRLDGRAGNNGNAPGEGGSSGAAILGWAGAAILMLMIGTCSSPHHDPASAPPAPAALAEPIASPIRIARVDGLRCRAAPEASAAVLDHLGRGERLSILASRGEWSKIASGAGECWVATRLTTPA